MSAGADPELERRLVDHLVATGRISDDERHALVADDTTIADAASGSEAPTLADRVLARGILSEQELATTLVALASPGPPTPAPASPPPRKPASRPPSGSDVGPGASTADRRASERARAALAAGGQRIGRYVVLDELGRGGMGVVLEAWDGDLRRRVAIKLIRAGAGEEELRRFEREARAAARLRHPGIVAVHEVGRHEGEPFIVMELIAGRSLEAALRAEDLPPRRIAQIVRGVALALAHAHSEGIVHRDVKPLNVLLDEGGEPRLGDFGLARDATAGEAEQITVTGQLIGTPSYMAPEQAGKDEIGPATDVYALGGLLYRALAGKTPFGGTHPYEVVRKVLFEDPVPPRRHRPSIHPDLETIALRCLEKEPARRYPSAGAVAEELRRFLDGEPIEARPLGRAERARRWLRRRRALVGVVAAAAAVTVVAVAVSVRASSARRTAELRGEVERAREALRASADVPFDERLKLQVAALEASRRLARELPGEAPVRREALAIALDFAREAIGAEQWSVAELALARAGESATEDERAAVAELVGVLERERGRTAREHRSDVLQVLARARAGEVAARRDGRAEAVLELTRYREPQTVALLAAALDEVSALLAEALREALAAAAAPDDVERRAGEQKIEGVEADLDRWLERGATALAPPDAGPALLKAVLRLEARRARAGRGTLPGGAIEMLGLEQQRRVPAGELDLARLCCDALGRLETPRGAVAALGRYLAVEMDGRRAGAAGVALARLGGAEAEALLIDRGRARFGPDGAYWIEVSRVLEETEASVGRPEPTSAEGWMELAITREGRADLAGAIEAFSRAIALEPDHLMAIRRRARARLVAEEIDGALVDLERALALAPGEAELYAQRAAIRSMRRDFAGALADRERAVELEPESAVRYYERAEVRGYVDDAAGRRADLERAVALMDPKTPVELVGRGRIHRELGDLERAIADFARAIEVDPALVGAYVERARARQAAGDLPGALTDLDRALELDPRDAAVTFHRAEVRKQRGDHEGWLADLDRAVALDPGNPIAWLSRGNARLLAGDPGAAVVDADRALAINPRDSFAFDLRARARHAMGDAAGAIADFDRALEIHPENGIGYKLRGDAKRTAGDAAGAIADYGRALERVPRFPLARIARGELLSAGGDHEAAIADFDAALEVSTTLDAAWNGRGLARLALERAAEAVDDFTAAMKADPGRADYAYNRGSARYRAGDPAGAIVDFGRAIALDPRHVNALISRGNLRLTRGEVDAALADLDAALAVDPDRADALSSRGGARLRDGDRDGALADFDRAVALSPGDPTALYHRGSVRLVQGDVAGAIEDLERVIALAPDHPSIDDVKTTLERARSRDEAERR